MGNPVSYLGATLTWEGRNLTSYENDNYTVQYEYDENGMRYRSTVTSKEDGQVGSFEYVWVDGKLISIVFVSDGSTSTSKYLYNDFEEPVGMIVTDDDGTLSTYYYLKNAQGDITNIVNANGRKLIEFTYDAFGNQTVHYQYDPSTIVGMLDLVEQVMVHSLTPFGYRGYCYDVYSGLYYLQSRYYDPQIGRFINADDTNYLNATGTVLGCNLFAYCENDPVNRVDAKGNLYYNNNYIVQIKLIVQRFLLGLIGKATITKVSALVIDNDYMHSIDVWYKKSKFITKKMRLTFGNPTAWNKSISNHYMSTHGVALDYHTGVITDEMNKLALFDTAGDFNIVSVFSSQSYLIYTLIENAVFKSTVTKKMNAAKKIYGNLYYMFKVSKESSLNGWYAYSVVTKGVVEL